MRDKLSMASSRACSGIQVSREGGSLKSLSVNPAFSLFELMIALAISSFIMLGMIQGYKNALNVLKNARELMIINRKVALLFNQMERDIGSVCPYQKPRKIRKPKQKGAQKEKTPGDGTGDSRDGGEGSGTSPGRRDGGDSGDSGAGENGSHASESNNGSNGGEGSHGSENNNGSDGDDSSGSSGSNDGASGEQKDRRRKKPIKSFSSEIFDDASYKIDGKKWQTTKTASFVTTSPLAVYGQHIQRVVRVRYELVPDKNNAAAKAAGKGCYKIVRKQTEDKENDTFKVKETTNRSAVPNVQEYVVADLVHSLSLEYTYEPRPPKPERGKKKEDVKKEEQEPLKSFTWGEKEEKQAARMFPDYVTVLLTLWNESFDETYQFETVMPILAPGPISRVKDKKKEGQKSGGEKSPDSQKPPGGQGPGKQKARAS